MSQSDDKTVFVGISETSDSGMLPPTIRPVTGSPISHVRKEITYVAQQTSLAEYTPGLNPLVNAASHLLLEVVRLRSDEKGFFEANAVHKKTERPSGLETEYDPISSYDVETLRSRLEAEVRGFEAQALAGEVDPSQVLAARYVLCTAVDEAIGVSSISESGEWSKLALLSTFHNETWGGEKFFNILERCMQQPARNLHLMELMYLLLSLGFEGKYRVLDRGPIALESVRDKLYRQIRLLRGEPNPDLGKKPAIIRGKEKLYAYVPIWLITVVVILCVGVSYGVFSLILATSGAPVVEQLEKYNTTGPAQPEAEVSFLREKYEHRIPSALQHDKGAGAC